jgi:hypothetical protein
VYRSSRSFKPIYLRCQLFSYWVEVFNEATFLMCKGVETVNTMIWTHATVANTTKRQSVNCNTKSSLTAFSYFLWCRFYMWNRWEKIDVKIPYLYVEQVGEDWCQNTVFTHLELLKFQMWQNFLRAYQWDPTQYQTYKLATNIFSFLVSYVTLSVSYTV